MNLVFRIEVKDIVLQQSIKSSFQLPLDPNTNSLNTNLPFHNEMTLRLQQELVVHYCGDAATGLQ